MNNHEACLIEDKELCRLCLDDGQTFVTLDGDIQTLSYDAPKLKLIREYVQSSQTLAKGRFLGRSPVIGLTSLALVEVMLELMSQQINREDDNTEQSNMEVQLATLCQAAIDESASDIHMEVHRNQTRFLIRVDGRRELLQAFANGESALRQPKELGVRLAAYIFNIRGRSNFYMRDPNNDSFIIELKWGDKLKSFEWRVAHVPLDKGIKITLRCLTPLDAPLTLSMMDLPKPYSALLTQTMARRAGGVIFTGPMGSGKTSSVYAVVNQIDRTARAVHSLEDPVEFEQSGVSKTAVETTKETKAGSGKYRDFAYFAKELLRHDTDVDLYGEVRDFAAAKAFSRKAETGGLAIATMHTNSAAGVPATLIEQFGLPSAVVSAPGLMLLFVHQRLIRKLCSCSLSLAEAEPIYAEHKMSEAFQSKRAQLHALTPNFLNSVRLTHPKGCEQCRGRGEKGRMLVMEMIALENSDREFIRQQDYLGWQHHLDSQGWPDIRQHTLHRIRKGQIDITSASEQVDGLMPIESKLLYQGMSEALS